MNYWYRIAKEAYRHGRKTIEVIATVPEYEGKKMLNGKIILRAYRYPFDSSIKVFVIE